jgi:hypothetical protein
MMDSKGKVKKETDGLPPRKVVKNPPLYFLIGVA